MALLMLPGPVFVHLNRSSFDRPPPVITGVVLEPRIGEAAKSAEAVAHDAGAGVDVGLCIGVEGLLGEPGDAAGVDWHVLTSGTAMTIGTLLARPAFPSFSPPK